jgi:hypothetical protein
VIFLDASRIGLACVFVKVLTLQHIFTSIYKLYPLASYEAEPLLNRPFCPARKVFLPFFGQFCLLYQY